MVFEGYKNKCFAYSIQFTSITQKALNFKDVHSGIILSYMVKETGEQAKSQTSHA